MPMRLPPPPRARGMRVSYRGNVEVIDRSAPAEIRVVSAEPAAVHRPDMDRPMNELRQIARSLGVEDLGGSKADLVGRITAARG